MKEEKVLALDCETNGLDPDRVWCVGTEWITTGEKSMILYPDKIEEEKEKLIKLCNEADKIVMHNGIEYDAPVLNKLIKADLIPFHKIVDTIVILRLIDFNLDFKGHSLKQWGIRIGLHKGEWTDWNNPCTEMFDYCQQDVTITAELYRRNRKFILDEANQKAINIEHEICRVCHQMHVDGFHFDKTQGQYLLAEIEDSLSTLTKELQESYPPKLVEVNSILYKKNKEGELYKNVKKAIDTYPKCKVQGSNLICYGYEIFNPGSPKQRIERLWESGWNPTEKTKTHYQFDRNPTALKNATIEERREKFNVYGYTTSQENLNTLPDTAPKGGKLIAKWLTLEGRRSSLTEWLNHVGADGRIHGSFLHIGAWTQRLAHYNPNEANIPSSFHGQPSTPVEEVKAKYDGPMRALWGVPRGKFQVGTDAEGIQLRVLAHILQSEAYVKAICEGNKEDETDIHNVNKRALGLNHIDRDDAKRFIYSFLLGAGTVKVAQILQCSTTVAKQAVDNFIQSIDGLAEFKKNQIPAIGMAGYFIGLDGRRVPVASAYLALAGMLQSGEAIIMKHATVLWQREAQLEGIPFKLLTWPHDEWQTEANNMEEAVRLGELQRQSITQAGLDLGLYCPMSGSTEIGVNWNECH